MKIASCDDSQAELTALVKYAASDKHQIMAYLIGENLYREIENGGRFDLISITARSSLHAPSASSPPR